MIASIFYIWVVGEAAVLAVTEAGSCQVSSHILNYWLP